MRRRSAWSAALCVVTLALAGCADGTGVPVSLPLAGRAIAATVAAGPVAPGAQISITVANGFDSQLRYGACSHVIDQRVGESWETVLDNRQQPCILVAYMIAPGTTDTVRVTAPNVAGTYRVRVIMTLEAPGGDEDVVATSNEFHVASGVTTF